MVNIYLINSMEYNYYLIVFHSTIRNVNFKVSYYNLNQANKKCLCFLSAIISSILFFLISVILSSLIVFPYSQFFF